MEKDARYFLVGIFVTVGIAALVGFCIWLAGSHDSRDYERFTVYFTDPVSGLKEGASVQYRGVDVGKVLDVRLTPGREDLIKVNIEVEENTPVRRDTEASLAVLGITGLVYMDLSTETTDNKPPRRLEGEKYPVLKGSGTQLAKIFQDVPTITKQIREISEKLNTFLDDENMASLEQTLANIQNMTQDLNGLLSEENVSNVSATMENFSQVSADVKDMVARFETTANEIEQAVHSLNEVIAANEGKINKFTTEGLDQITATAREARKMVEAVRAMTEKLNRDPSQILYQPRPHGVEIPK